MSQNLLLTTAEQLLSNTLGSPIRLHNIEPLTKPGRRNLLLRCQAASVTSGFPSSFIIKKVEMDSSQSETSNVWDVRRFFSDWVGAQFLSTLPGEPDHSPRFYAGDSALGFFILEDLGPHQSLVGPLLEGDAASAEKTLLKFATRLGKLHADTIGQATRFEKLFQAVSPTVRPFAYEMNTLYEQMKQLQLSLQKLEVRLEADFQVELEAILTAVGEPGPFLAYIHADPCPDNLFYSGEQVRLIDFEFGRFGHALIDGVYGRMMFPTCWCANRLPHSIVTQMETAYRIELVKGCPAAQEDYVFETALVTLSGFWLLQTLSRHLENALVEDRRWGIATLHPRVLARLEAFIATAEEFDQLPALRGTASRLLELLRQRWLDTQPLPLYPAFQNCS